MESLQRQEDFTATIELCISVNETSQLSNDVVLWQYVEDYTPYRMIRGSDMRKMKGGIRN